MPMHAIAHEGCTDTVRESELKVNPLRQCVCVCACARWCVCMWVWVLMCLYVGVGAGVFVCGCGCRFGGADGCIPLTMLVDICQSWTYI